MDLSKTIIRIIQDICFAFSARILINEFTKTISLPIQSELNANSLSLSRLIAIVKKRNDFFIANDIDLIKFCKKLYSTLKFELSFSDNVDFISYLLEYKRKMENGNFRGFPKETVTEDTLRCSLVIYLQQETFCEPRSSGGFCDIIIPSERTIIETKIWKGLSYYESGLPELEEYLDKNAYQEGYYVIFDYNRSQNEIISSKGEVFNVYYKRKLIHIVFIKMNPTPPSKIYILGKKK